MDETSVRVPDAIEPIAAYRAWAYSMGHGGAQLFPLTTSGWCDEWKNAGTEWVSASCRLHLPHAVPSEDCSCGFYSLKELPVAIGLASTSLPIGADPDVGFVVLGRVLLSGKVIEHGIGYRAERARIAELIPLRGTERSIMVLAHRLGVGMAAAVEPTPRAHPPLASRHRPAPQPATTASDDDAAWHVTAGVLSGLFLLMSSVLLLTGVWVPPFGACAIAFLTFGRHAEPMADSYRGWRAQRRRGRLKGVPIVPPAP